MKYTIGEMSQLLGVPPHMLRYYEKVGIIRPETNRATDTVDWLADLGVQWKDTVTQPVGAM